MWYAVTAFYEIIPEGTSSYDDVVALAGKGLGEGPRGYRREFVRLAEAMKQLAAD